MIAAAVTGVVGVSLYVAAWAIAGALIPDYDPLQQAISETFALGAPMVPATLVRVSLVLSGIALVVFAWALHVGLPGSSRLGPLVCAASGVLTIGVVAAPCTDGCPGAGSTLIDTLHVGIAGAGYLALILTPLLIAVRVREHAPAFAVWSLVLGGLALVGFVARYLGLDAVPGLQQRVFNTLADLWYVVAAIHLIRWSRPDKAVRRT